MRSERTWANTPTEKNTRVHSPRKEYQGAQPPTDSPAGCRLWGYAHLYLARPLGSRSISLDPSAVHDPWVHASSRPTLGFTLRLARLLGRTAGSVSPDPSATQRALSRQTPQLCLTLGFMPHLARPQGRAAGSISPNASGSRSVSSDGDPQPYTQRVPS